MIGCFSLVVRVSGALGHAKIQVQIHVYVDREEVISVSIRSLRMALCLEWRIRFILRVLMHHIHEVLRLILNIVELICLWRPSGGLMSLTSLVNQAWWNSDILHGQAHFGASQFIL